MRLANNAKISHQDEEIAGERKNTSPINRNTHSVLTLPRLNPNIQSNLDAGDHSRNLAGLALNLLRRGFIEATAEGEVSQMIQAGIQKWVLAHTGDLKLFDFSLVIRPELDYITEFMYDEDSEALEKNFQKEHGTYLTYLCIEPGALPIMAIGKKLLEIETKVEGLGKTAYYWLSVCGARAFDIYTPWRGTDIAESVWWYGMDNDEDFKDEIQNYYEDDEEVQADAMEVSPSNWGAAFPEWVTKIDKALTEEELTVIANTDKESLEAKVAQLVLALIENKDAQLPDIIFTSFQPVYNSMYIHWEEGDMSNRLVDDMFEQINGAGGEGYLETLGISPIPNKPFLFRKWMAEMEKGWVQLKNIEQLVDLIGTRCN